MYLTPQPTISAGYNSLEEFELMLFDYLEYRLSLLGDGCLSVSRKSGYTPLDSVSEPLSMEFVLKHTYISRGETNIGALTVLLNYTDKNYLVGHTPEVTVKETVYDVINTDFSDIKTVYYNLLGNISERLKGYPSVQSNLVLEPSVYAHDLVYDELPFSVIVEMSPKKATFRRYTQYGMVLIERKLNEPYAHVNLKYDGIHLEGHIKDVIPYSAREVYTVISNTLQNELKKRGN